MKLIARSDGVICTTVSLNRRAVVRSGSRARKAAITAPTKITVPGMAMKFRLTVASSGVGIGATGGILSTALCRNGIGIRKASKFKYRLIAGRPVTKIRIDAMTNGDQPFNISAGEWRVAAVSVCLLTGMTSDGFQTLRNAT